MLRHRSRPRAHTCVRVACVLRRCSFGACVTVTTKPAKANRAIRQTKSGADLNLAVGGDTGSGDRKRRVRIIEADAVVEGEGLFLDRRLHSWSAAAIADDATGYHRRSGERVDVAD